jgi:hypothetical protein
VKVCKNFAVNSCQINRFCLWVLIFLHKQQFTNYYASSLVQISGKYLVQGGCYHIFGPVTFIYKYCRYTWPIIATHKQFIASPL